MDDSEDYLTKGFRIDERIHALEMEVAQLRGIAEGLLLRLQHQLPASSEVKFEIVDVSCRITNASASSSRYSWRVVIRSGVTYDLRVDIFIQFRDADSFVVDTDSAQDLLLRAGREEVFSGYALVDPAVVDSIASVNARVVPS